MLKVSVRFLFFVSFILSMGCHWGCQTNPRLATPQPPAGYEAKITPLDLPGENFHGRFYDGNDLFFYISRNRYEHKNTQIYEYNISKNSSRRLTFQDGEVLDLAFVAKDPHIYYVSTTDEIKEQPSYLTSHFNKKKDVQDSSNNSRSLIGELLPGTEIYQSSLNGRDIKRLTQEPGFDGSLYADQNNKNLHFVSWRNGSKKLKTWNAQTKKVTTQNKWSAEGDYYRIAPKKDWIVWSKSSEKDPNSSELWLMDIAQKTEILLASGTGHHIEAVWHPNGEDIIFSSNRHHPNQYQLFAVRADGSCLRQMTYSNFSHRSPDFSPDGKRLLFTLIKEVRTLAFLEYAPPPCPTVNSSIQ